MGTTRADGEPRPNAMHGAATELMRTLAATIEAEERIAGYLASVADWADAMGETGVADGLSDRARGHHVKVITQRARLGALVEQYGALHLD